MNFFFFWHNRFIHWVIDLIDYRTPLIPSSPQNSKQFALVHFPCGTFKTRLIWLDLKAMEKRVEFIIKDLSQIISLGLDMTRLYMERKGNIEQIVDKRNGCSSITLPCLLPFAPLPPTHSVALGSGWTMNGKRQKGKKFYLGRADYGGTGS